MPWETALEDKGVCNRAGISLRKSKECKTWQSPSKTLGKEGKKMAWLNMDLLVKLK